MARVIVPLVAALLVAACGAVGRVPAPHPPSPSASPTVADLQYDLLVQVGPVWYCSPDLYPVARPVSDADVLARLTAARDQDAVTYATIVRHHGLDPTTAPAALTTAQRRAAYADLMDLRALPLRPDPAGGGYLFDYTVRPPADRPGQPGTRVLGRIDPGGRISVRSRAARTLLCPLAAWRGDGPSAVPLG